MSTPTTVIFLDQPERWLKIEDGRIIERGEGFPAPAEGIRIVGIVPASNVIVHHLALSGLTDAQARAAARLAVAENSVSPIATLHVAIGAELDGERTVVALNAAQMTSALSAFTAHGIDPDAIIAAPLILRRPDVGFVIADLGRETIIRGRDDAFLDDPVLTPLLAGGSMVTLDAEATDAAIIAAAAAPEVDLRQGIFTRRRRWGVEAGRLRRIRWLITACVASLFILPVAELIRHNTAARDIEAHNVAVAASALPPGTVVTDPLAQLDERLAEVGGAGGGFLPLANAVASAAQATANVELGAITYDDSGLHVSAHATGLPELAAFENHMVASGLTVIPAPAVAAIGQPTRDFTVRAW